METDETLGVVALAVRHGYGKPRNRAMIARRGTSLVNSVVLLDSQSVPRRPGLAARSKVASRGGRVAWVPGRPRLVPVRRALQAASCGYVPFAPRQEPAGAMRGAAAGTTSFAASIRHKTPG